MRALAGRLELRQTQSLALTPQLLQAIRLLQMSAAELEAFVERELEQNPLIDRAEAADDVAPQPDGDDRRDWPAGDRDAVAAGAAAAPSVAERHERPSVQNANGGGVALDGPEFQNIASAAPSLSAHLEAQIEAAFREPEDIAVARLLLANLDECGYLTAGLDAIAEEAGVAAARVAEVLARCQRLELSGVFARSLAECLALQLADRGRLDPAMRLMLDNLDILARRDLAALRRACGVDDEDLAEMVAELMALDPKPGLAFAGDPVPAVLPDVLVRAARQGGWTVKLNEATLPRILVDRRYHAELAGAGGGEARQFLDGCLSQATWLERSLDQRATTILKVATEIVRHQDGFLMHGPAHLRPLALKDVAAATGLHESTVSRATANKFMSTPRGTLAMRAFFSGGLASTAGGQEHSAAAVRHRVRQLIEAEPAGAPLSDDAIAERLKSEGVAIARRTVAKYREQSGIPSSAARRRRAG
ncbi:MAG TPA: RNA polymerase factor sigma-54 [Afifellaceae bacterium]|nr:RNA polymerase factor sigma-54 [Afifellaceae bacterium]